MSTDNRFPVLYGRRIRNTGDFVEAQAAVIRDVLAGKITPTEANAISRQAGEILKMFQAVVTCGKLGHRASKQNLVR